MSKRHNRKRTRSRPRHRNNNNTPVVQAKMHPRSHSVDTTSSQSTHASFNYGPMCQEHHWHQTYMAWQTRRLVDQERDREVEMQRLRIFGGVPGDEVSLLEPMLKVVTDLFDGFTDYEDP